MVAGGSRRTGIRTADQPRAVVARLERARARSRRRRVLPLLERVKFCAIFSPILDEFFMVRVAGLMDQAARSRRALRRRADAADGARRDPRACHSGSPRASRSSGGGSSGPRSPPRGSRSSQVDDCGEKELRELEQRFEREIYPVLTPLGVGPGQPFPYISGLSLTLGVLARDPETGEERFARVKVPEGLPRFVEVGERGRLVPLESVIAHFLPRSSPAWRSSSARSSGSRATRTSRSPTRRTTCSRRSSSSCAAAASATSCGSRCRARRREAMLDRLAAGLGAARRAGVRDRRPARPRRPRPAARRSTARS